MPIRGLRGWVSAAILSLLAVAWLPASAEEAPAFDKSALPQVFDEIERRQTPQAFLEQCPADIWRQSAWFGYRFIDSPDVSYESCEQDPMACMRACFDDQSPDACFQAARVIQENTEKDQQHWTHAMFAQACATGSAGGCTNRGAGIRNESIVPQFLRDAPDVDGQSAAHICLHRSFELACGQDDAWGCAMYGQALHYGEGVPADAGQALAAYRKSCALDPDFPSCEFAKAHIEVLERQ